MCGLITGDLHPSSVNQGVDVRLSRLHCHAALVLLSSPLPCFFFKKCALSSIVKLLCIKTSFTGFKEQLKHFSNPIKVIFQKLKQSVNFIEM